MHDSKLCHKFLLDLSSLQNFVDYFFISIIGNYCFVILLNMNKSHWGCTDVKLLPQYIYIFTLHVRTRLLDKDLNTRCKKTKREH